MPGIRTLSALLAFTATTIAGPLTARAQSSNVVVYWVQLIKKWVIESIHKTDGDT